VTVPHHVLPTACSTARRHSDVTVKGEETMHGTLRYLSLAALGFGAALALSGTASAAEWDTMLRPTNSVYQPSQQQAQPTQQQQAAQPTAATTVAKQGNQQGNAGQVQR
jgi:hypothetical protein